MNPQALEELLTHQDVTAIADLASDLPLEHYLSALTDELQKFLNPQGEDVEETVAILSLAVIAILKALVAQHKGE